MFREQIPELYMYVQVSKVKMIIVVAQYRLKRKTVMSYSNYIELQNLTHLYTFQYKSFYYNLNCVALRWQHIQFVFSMLCSGVQLTPRTMNQFTEEFEWTEFQLKF